MKKLFFSITNNEQWETFRKSPLGKVSSQSFSPKISSSNSLPDITFNRLILLCAIADAGQYHIFESVDKTKYLKEGKTKVYTTIEFTILRLEPSTGKNDR